MKQLSFLIVIISLNSCSFIRYMNTKEKMDKSENEISAYLEKINFKTYNYSLKMKDTFLAKLVEDKHVLDLYKKERNTSQSTMQIRVYGKDGHLITGYTQCYGNLNLINILRKKEFVNYDHFYNNYNLEYEDEFELFNITKDEKNKLISESTDKNKIVIYWNIWSNYYSKIMLKKTKKYVKKFDPEMKETFILLVNNDFTNYN